MKKMSLLSKNLFGLFVITLFSSCSTSYDCFVNAFGVTPQVMSYYIEPMDASLIDNLEYLEYAEILKTRLNEIGYIEESSGNAALCVKLGYYYGDKYLSGMYSSTNNYTSTNGTTLSRTNTSIKGNAKSDVSGNTVTTNATGKVSSSVTTNKNETSQTYSSTSTSANYQQDIGCIIETLDNKTKKPIWSVEVTNAINISNNTNFRLHMPWLITAAQPYFGKSVAKKVELYQNKAKKQGLKWPYRYFGD